MAQSQPQNLLLSRIGAIQRRATNPKAVEVARLTWPNVSIPQVPIPITIHGHHYLLEIDEFARDLAAAPPSEQTRP